MIHNIEKWSLALLGLLAVSCSDDWDKHYEEQTHGDGSLWRAICNDPQLSNFRDVLQATGFERSLDGSQVFTVFAPTNAQFTTAQRDSVIALFKEQKAQGIRDNRNAAIKEFVQNHVALYNYSVSSVTNDSIRMMNGKYLVLGSNGLGSSNFLSKNTQSTNGLLFTLDYAAEYNPNVFEYIARDADLDSLYRFVYQYNEDKFNASESVPGEIINGVTHYLDSVTNLQNEIIFSALGNFSREDSTYWLLAPTNKAWAEQLAVNEQFFQYDKTVPMRDSLMYLYPRINIIGGTLFSRTINPDKAIRDSVLSTNALTFQERIWAYGRSDFRYYMYDAPFDSETGIFANTVNVPCSNGQVMKSDEWRISRSKTFVNDIVMEGESSMTLDSVDTKSTRDLTYVSVASVNPFYDQISFHSYIELTPTGSGNFSGLFRMYNVLSNLDYDLYVVSVPAVAGDTLAVEEQRKPCTFRATVLYHDMNGKEVSFPVSSNLTTDPDRVDSVFVGTYRFPTSSWSLDRAQVKVKLDGRVSNTDVKNKKATKTLRIDSFILKPHVGNL